MGRVLLEFWPVLLPLSLFLFWRFLSRHHARRRGRAIPRYKEGPWFWIWVSSLLIAIACLITWWFFEPKETGIYVPAKWKDGVLVPSHIEQGEKP